MGGENHGRLYLLFVVVVASAADWQLLSVSERERAIARKREGSKKRASRKSRHTNIHTAANLIKNIK